MSKSAIVVGAGAFGASSAIALAKRGGGSDRDRAEPCPVRLAVDLG